MPATLQRSAYAMPMFIVGPDGEIVNLAGLLQSVGGSRSGADLDTSGNPVPTNLAHTFTYDTSGNIKTDSVASPDGTWVRTYTYQNGQMTVDSGWVKQ